MRTAVAKEKLVQKDLSNANETWTDGQNEITGQRKVFVNGVTYIAPAVDDAEVSPLMASVYSDANKIIKGANVDVAFQNGRVQDGVKIDLDID